MPVSAFIRHPRRTAAVRNSRQYHDCGVEQQPTRSAGDEAAWHALSASTISQQSTEDLGQELTRTSHRQTFLVRGLGHRVPLPLLPRQSGNSAMYVVSSGSKA